MRRDPKREKTAVQWWPPGDPRHRPDPRIVTSFAHVSEETRRSMRAFGDTLDDTIFEKNPGCGYTDTDNGMSAGRSLVQPGDWIVQDDNGLRFVVSDPTFQANYFIVPPLTP
jgi:hypothetical protein